MSSPYQFALDIASAWGRLERIMSGNLARTRGISFAEFRLLHALSKSYEERSTRVDLASAVGLTPSGVTRALRPLEKIGMVESKKSARDARLTLSVLTASGREVVADCSKVVDDVMRDLLKRSTNPSPGMAECLEILAAPKHP